MCALFHHFPCIVMCIGFIFVYAPIFLFLTPAVASARLVYIFACFWFVHILKCLRFNGFLRRKKHQQWRRHCSRAQAFRRNRRKARARERGRERRGNTSVITHNGIGTTMKCAKHEFCMQKPNNGRTKTDNFSSPLLFHKSYHFPLNRFILLLL